MRPAAAAPRRFKFALGELRREFSTLNAPIVDGLFRERETVNIIANSKAGKSWFVYGLSLTTIIGGKWLGRFATVPGRVLLVDNELHAATVAHRIPEVGDALAIPCEHYERDLHVWTLRGNLQTLADLEAAFDDVEPGTYRLIVLDAKYRFATDGVSENDNAAEALFYNRIDRIAERTKAAVVLVHHATKGNQSEKRVTDVGAGAGAQSRAADCHLVLREHEEPGVAVLDAAVRSFAPVEPIALRWNFPLWVPADDIDPAKLKGRATAGEIRQSDRDRDGVARIIDALRAGHATARQLRAATGLSRERLQRLLDSLTADGQITVSATTVRGNTTHEYALDELQI